MSHKTCAQKKKERDRDRQREYVGDILMDNRDLYKQMMLVGFPVTVSVTEATSGNSKQWEQEKQTYLNSEKVSLAEAINYFGADTIIDLTLGVTSQPSDPIYHIQDDEDPIITVQQSSGVILTSHTVEGRLQSSTTKFEVPHADLGSNSKRVIVAPIAAEDICDILAEGEDTQIVADQFGYLGSFLTKSDSFELPQPTIPGCSKICTIPIEVLNIMVREDQKLAQRCQLIRRALSCNHLQGLQILERPDAVVYDMQTLTMGKVPNERGFSYFKYFGRIQARPHKELSASAWHYLHTLSNRDIAMRALGNTLRFSQHPGRRATILYNWNSGAPKHELFPIRFSS